MLKILFTTLFHTPEMKYAPYGSYFVMVMEIIEKMYPGLKDLLI